jgi:predicted dehydrogenase
MVLSELTDSYHQGGIVYGSDGIIELLSTSLRIMNKDTAGKWEHHSPSGKFFNSDSIDNFVTAEGNTAQADELADWINGNIEIHRGEATNGYKAIEMAYAIYESARLHERVSIPLQTRSNPLELMIDSGHLPVRYPGMYDIRWRQLRGENMGIDTDNV